MKLSLMAGLCHRRPVSTAGHPPEGKAMRQKTITVMLIVVTANACED